MGGIQVAEAKPRRGPKTLDHLELHPKLGGGTIVKHVYTDYSHEPKEVHFNEDGVSKGGGHIVDHLIKHGGLPKPEGYENGAAEAEPEEQD